MDTKKTSLLAIVLILLTFAGFGQQRELNIGDKIPDLVIDNIINQSSDKIELKELYKDGLLIIDFWATWCVPCVQEMKFLDLMQNWTFLPKSMKIIQGFPMKYLATA